VTELETQSAAFWGEAFEIEDSDLDYLYNLLLEEETPVSTDEMALAIIERRVERETQAAKRRDEGTTVFKPKDTYATGQVLVFPALEYVAGTVVAVRPGRNPELSEFDVLQVDFGEGRPTREFAARLAEHKLNQDQARGLMGEVKSPRALYEEHGASIATKLEDRLEANPDIVRLAGRWFPRALLATVNIGHLNLAEAVLDMAQGGPLPTDALLKDAGLPTNIHPRLQAFSLHFALQEDARFDEVGPSGQVAWFLKRLEPEPVLNPPRRLQNSAPTGAASNLPEVLADLITELDDEFTPGAVPAEAADEVQVTVTYPHRRSGTLPRSPRLAGFFPTAIESPRIRFLFVDGDTGEKFPGWVVREGKFAYGLEDWYRTHDFQPGGHLAVRKGEAPGEVIVQARKRRPTREWVRTATASSDGYLSFSMQKQLIGVDYDDLMMVAVGNQAAVDDVWQKSQNLPFAKLVADVFRELAKLNPQSAVHAKTLYAAVNVARRSPPGSIFAQLTQHPYYVLVGDAYWRFDQTRWTE
jgi:hypothetical protein